MDEAILLSALRGDQRVADVCRVAGITPAEFAAERAAYLTRRLPPVETRLPAAVQGRVEILRDRAGVPHVYADRTDDLYFGLGFAMAQDRLWQMDRLRRRALGRQAEVLGRDYLASDVLHRTVGIDVVSAAEVERTDARTRALLEAFVGGINRQMEQARRDLPIEFVLLDYAPAPFTVRDVIAILRGMWWSLNGRLENLVVAEAARLLPSEELRAAYLTPEAPEDRIVPPGSPYPPADRPLEPVAASLAGMGDATGSNNWAVAGRRTASGQALLCGDPHQPFWLPASWYEYAVHGPEDDAAGAGHPGVPGLWWGSNGTIAWSLTNNAASTRDLYREEIDPADPSQYREGDGWRRFDERTVAIPVRGAAAERVTIRATVRGPLVGHLLLAVDEGGNPPLSLRWVGHEHLDDVRAAVAIGRARDWPSFRNALRDWSVAVFNFAYADHTGFVGYQCAGRVPVRGRVVRGFREAGNPADAWQGAIPFDALPRLEDPPRGYVASANQRTAPDDYPYPLYGAYAAGHRGIRLGQALTEGAIDQAAAIALQNDVKSTRAERLCPPLLRRLAASDDADARQLHDALAGWDYHYTLDSSAPTLFEAFMHAWQERVAAERFPARLVSLVKGQGGVAARLIETDDLPWFAGGTTTALIETARAASRFVREQFGADAAGWRWGVVHRAHWQHLLSNAATAPAFDVGPAPVDGCGDTVRNTGTGLTPAYAAASGAEYRLVVDFAAPRQFLAVQNVGNSGQPGSPHYADQFPRWLAGEYHIVHLDRAEVERDRAGQTVLEPERKPPAVSPG